MPLGSSQIRDGVQRSQNRAIAQIVPGEACGV
jgi:hypothetical protein